jgi:hypothetical protein
MRRLKHIKPISPVWVGVFALVFLSACSPAVKYNWAQREQMEWLSGEPVRKRQGLKASCMDYKYYIPELSMYGGNLEKHIKMEFHVMNTSDSTQNFREEEAYRFIAELIQSVNEGFEKNQQMWLPLGNKTPVLPVKIRCVLYPDQRIPNDRGIYFHYDDSLYYFVSRGTNRNISDPAVIRRYKVRDSVLSVFMMPHHRDSIASETYTPFESGIALSSGLKIAGIFENGKQNGWESRGLLAHELGHALGLSHTWPGYDGCEDTPAHTNCWNFSETPPCDSDVSNNLMDYNPYQTALSPCQIGKMHLNISRLNSAQRLITDPYWCSLDTLQNIIISEQQIWQGSRDISGHIRIKAGGSLELHCRVSMPPGGTIFIEPGGKLVLSDAWLHQACGSSWEGISIGKKGKLIGQVTVFGNVTIENCLNCPDFSSELQKP